MKPIELDGRTGEGGGQLIRVAVGLAALTTQPVKITNVRGNRPRGGGLGSQHVTSIKWLAEATDAQVEGLSVGSQTLTFIPRRPPTELIDRKIKISADSGAASTLLILQAVLPFLVFAGDEAGEPIELIICGGTNVSFSLSFEYLDQVLLPTLEERFGIRAEREVKRRGWSLGPQSRGEIFLKIFPLCRGEKLTFKPKVYTFPESYQVASVDISIVAPTISHDVLQTELLKDLGTLFPDADLRLNPSQDSGSDTRWYVLLVAHSSGSIRWGRDVLCSMPKKTKSRDNFAASLSRKLCRELYNEGNEAGQVDDHLQDQIIFFQAVCDGVSTFPRGEHPTDTARVVGREDLDVAEGNLRREKTFEPFGRGTLHAQTARWVVSELLPKVEFYNKGDIVKGIGMAFSGT